jgi:predicted Holliday junction resolvase-like endonuclease
VRYVACRQTPMTKKTKIFMTVWSVLVLVMVLVNILIGLGNQSVQAEVTERQQEIAQTIQLEALNRQLVTVLASMAVKTNDAQLKKLLADSGVNVGNDAAAAPQKK